MHTVKTALSIIAWASGVLGGALEIERAKGNIAWVEGLKAEKK